MCIWFVKNVLILKYFLNLPTTYSYSMHLRVAYFEVVWENENIKF